MEDLQNYLTLLQNGAMAAIAGAILSGLCLLVSLGTLGTVVGLSRPEPDPEMQRQLREIRAKVYAQDEHGAGSR